MTLEHLVAVVLVANVMSFGSATVMLGLLQQSLVTTSAVLTNQQLLYAFAIARVTPGQANLYVAAIGFMLFGLPGALSCVAAITLPSYAMVPLVRGYGRLRKSAAVGGFTLGVASAATGVVLATAFGLVRDYADSPLALTVLVLALGLMASGRIATIAAMAIATGVGILMAVGPTLLRS